MKKMIVILMALCCLLVTAVADEASPVGTWYIGRAMSNGAEIQVVDPEAIVLTVNEDNTFTLVASGVSGSGTWTFEDSAITLIPEPQEGAEEQEPVVYRLEDGELLYDIGTAVIHLSRTPAEPVALSPAAEAASADEFSGCWKPAAQIVYGLYGPADEAGIASLSIGDGKIILLLPGDDGKMAPYGEYETSFADGMLTAEDTSFGSSRMTLSMHEDGSLFYNVVTDFGMAKLDLTYVYFRGEFEIASVPEEAEDESRDESEYGNIPDDFNGTTWENGDLKLEAVWQDGYYKIAVTEGDTELSYLCDLGMGTGYLFAFGTGIAELDGEQADYGRGIFFISDGNLVWQKPDGTETVFTRIQ